MKTLHVTSINTTISNGVRFSVPGLVAAQNKIVGLKSVLLNVTPQLAEIEETSKYDFEYLEYRKGSVNEINFLSYDLIVFHSFYHKEFLKIYKIINRLGIPYIIVPRGIFTHLARKRKFFKKIIADILFFDDMIKKSRAIHFLTKEEMSNSRYLNKHCFVVPNGINRIENPRFRKEVNTIVYLGRLDSYTKGLDLLIEAVKLIENYLNNNKITINLYGSDFPVGSKNILQKNINKKGLNRLVTINEPVYGEEKHFILQSADMFISPSRFEGMPMSILEALSHGLPCLVTDQTNIGNEIREYEAGWVTNLDAIEISKKIIEAVEDKNLEVKTNNAYKLIQDEFEWAKVAEKTYNEYLKITGK
jgi:glycosyltransferase involved in cell wall biosynthesis